MPGHQVKLPVRHPAQSEADQVCCPLLYQRTIDSERTSQSGPPTMVSSIGVESEPNHSISDLAASNERVIDWGTDR